ncbi:Response regulator receiver domain protein [Pseudovibrio sp. Ad5]|uniref:response regulator n=1 Tax=Pseudovibrio sp. Ad5 TaxID=989436 RepID=UPI0007AE892E|nr:response regulator [Pseudovibrio sp. Ad5]KZK96429.1 Response regulator receiver domain protein [Pseudovibrio sp. Ad5]
MNLDYSILWFEDKPKWLKPVEENLGMELSDLGFRLEVQNELNGTQVAKLAGDSRFDLILMDYDLKATNGDKINGDELIKEIRQKYNYFTDIIFYSNKPVNELRSAIFKNGMSDGVYCLNRSSKQFEDDILKIVSRTIKKVLDVNNMRGIAMASVADCDQIVISSIETRWNQLEGENKSALTAKALEKLEKIKKSLEKKIANLSKTDDIGKILKDHDFPSRARFHVLNSIVKHKSKCELVGPVRTNIQAYEELLQHRNRLGHAKAVNQKGLTVFVGHDNVKYDDSSFSALRRMMIEQEAELSKMLGLITDGKLDN